MKTKKLLASIIVSITLTISNANMPVVDFTSIMQQIIGYIETAKEYANEAQRWKSTIENYKNFSGIRDVFGFLLDLDKLKSMTNFTGDFSDFMNALNQNPEKYFDSVDNGDELKEIYEQLRDYDYCQHSWRTQYSNDEHFKKRDLQALCQQETLELAKLQSVFQESEEKFNSMRTSLNDLSTKAKNATDAKESADIANSLQLINAQMQAEATNLQLKISQIQYQEKIRENHKKQVLHKSMQTPSSVIDKDLPTLMEQNRQAAKQLFERGKN